MPQRLLKSRVELLQELVEPSLLLGAGLALVWVLLWA